MAVSITFILIIKKKIKKELKLIFYIQYLVIFNNKTEALLYLGSEVNAINQVFAS